MRAIKYIEGAMINGLVFIKDDGHVVSPSRKSRAALFKCKCGKVFRCMIQSVVRGNTCSCGCYKRAITSSIFKKHGLRKHPIYKIWSGIKTRCYNRNRVDYKYYGGVGIILSEEFHDFINFFNYVTHLPDYEKVFIEKLTIDRKDVRKNYEKGNLRWATRKQQSLNQRRNTGF